MGSALETLCGQAYGAEQYRMLGVHTQRAMLVLMLMAIPISIIWCFTGTIFTWFGQDSEISSLAGSYTRWLIPSIFPYGILQCQFRFLQTQSKTKVLMISTGFTSLVHILVCWILVLKIGLGCQGAALACVVSYWTNVLVLSVYIKFSTDFEKTWTGFCKEGVTNLSEFLVLSIPSALMVWLVNYMMIIEIQTLLRLFLVKGTNRVIHVCDLAWSIGPTSSSFSCRAFFQIQNSKPQ